jgi:hypothetical protein
MTFLAWNSRVQSDQRKARQIMIERYLFAPPGFRMAALTAFTELAFVGITFLMAGHACRSELVSVQVALVA